MIPVVIDTNVVLAALGSGGGPSREVIRRALNGRYLPLFGTALWLEYEDVMNRPIGRTSTSADERREILAALAQCGQWITIYFGWRPNLGDEGDNHLTELAVAGNAEAIVTHNIKDLSHGELNWENLSVVTPAQCLEVLP